MASSLSPFVNYAGKSSMFASLRAGAASAISDLFPIGRWVTPAWCDIKLRYRRTLLGPFWMTLNVAVMILSVGAVWGLIFRMSMQEYLPYFALGMVLWNFIATTLAEGCRVFIDAQHVIKAVPNPLIIYVWRLMARQIVCLAHNVIFVALLWVVMQRPIGSAAVLAIPGIVILTVALSGATLTLGILCARFRDIPQLITAMLQVLFLVTPIIWVPALVHIDGLPSFLIHANPLYGLIENVRAPLLGHDTFAAQWIYAAGSASLMLAIGLLLLGRFVKRIPYWL
jgi:lipopolysaccharide transport system permease protein